jgi:hypothetical protein
VSTLNAANVRAFTVELSQAIEGHDSAQRSELLEDWRVTAETLKNPDFMQAYRQSDDLAQDIPWDQVHGEFDLSRDSEPERL